MADDGSAQATTVWPLPQFRFEVRWDTAVMSFQEVSGLESEDPPIEYRHGNSPAFSPLKLPSAKKLGNVTLKKGLFKGDAQFLDRFNGKTNAVSRQALTISLLDEAGQPAMVWTLLNAWPSKVLTTGLKSQGKEVAIESMEFVHEGVHMGKA